MLLTRSVWSGVATFCRVGTAPCSTSPILPLAADEGFTGLLHRSQNGDIEGGKGRVGCYEEVAKTEMSTPELLQLDSEGRCLITDHGSFGTVISWNQIKDLKCTHWNLLLQLYDTETQLLKKSLSCFDYGIILRALTPNFYRQKFDMSKRQILWVTFLGLPFRRFCSCRDEKIIMKFQRWCWV